MRPIVTDIARSAVCVSVYVLSRPASPAKRINRSIAVWVLSWLVKVKLAHTRITKRRVPELIPVFGSQPAGDVTHKPGGRLPLLSARPAVTPATLKRAAANFAAC